MRQIIAILFATLLLSASNVFAWSAAGHMVIAAEAYRQLPKDAQSKVNDLLKFHPDYEKWKEANEKAGADVDLPLYVFMRASTWPDEIRRAKGAGSRKYDHPHWHYVDYALKAPKFPMEPGPSPKDDILYGIAQCEKTLADTKAAAEGRAVYLSWLIHLVGDLHQPLHCSSLVNETYPHGDKGGNDFWVKPASRGIKLHSLWDGLLGTSGKPRTLLNSATQIQAEHPSKTLKELTTAKTPKEWSLEGREIAIEKGYLRGELKGGTDAESGVELPGDYTKNAKTAAEKQAALAGYRLADEIQKCAK